VSVFEQIETKILELEARAELTGASITDSLEEEFAALEDGDNVDIELAKMKAKQLRSQK
jgi:phage shock protein A